MAIYIEVYIYLPHINKHQQIKSEIHLLINQLPKPGFSKLRPAGMQVSRACYREQVLCKG